MREVSGQSSSSQSQAYTASESTSGGAQEGQQVVQAKKQEVNPEEVSRRVDHVLGSGSAATGEEAQGLYKQQQNKSDAQKPKPQLGSFRQPESSRQNGDINWDDVEGMSVAQLMALAKSVSVKAGQDRARVAGQSVDIAATRINAQNEQNISSVKEYVDKQAQVAASENGPGSWILAIFGFIAAVFAAVAAVVAAPFTGGASLLIAGVAIMGAVTAGIALVSKISVAAGGPAFTASDVLQLVFQKIFEALGMDETKAKQVASLLGAPVALLMSPFDQKGLESVLRTLGQLGGQSDEEINKWLQPLMITIGVVMAIGMIAMSFAGGGANASSALANIVGKITPQLVGFVDKSVKAAKLAIQVGSMANDVKKGVLTMNMLDQEVVVKEGQAELRLAEANQDQARDSLQAALKQLQASVDTWSKVTETTEEIGRKIARNSRA